MGLFTGIEDAKISAGGVYFVEGLYIVEIVKVSTIRSRKNEDLFIVETEIQSSSAPERKVGTTCSWVVNLKQDAALGNIKAFIAAANGIDPADTEQVKQEITEEVVEFACSDDNPLAGTKLNLECVAIKTKAQKDFTLHKWTPFE